MIELPEAHVLAKQVNSVILGKRITNVIANHTPHSFANYTCNPEDYNNLLKGKTITGASALGNHVYITADDMTLIINTPILYHAVKDSIPKKHQLLLEFDDTTSISCTVQMWGAFYCFKSSEKDKYNYDTEKDKPSPLSCEFDVNYFKSLFNDSTKKLSAKAFLATEQRIPGLGNGVLQDILWSIKINPKFKVSELSEKNFIDMFNAIKSVLSNMEAKGGRDTERDLFGNFGGYKTVLSKNTAGKPCPTCGDIIKKAAYMGGSIYFCPTCQPEKR